MQDAAWDPVKNALQDLLLKRKREPAADMRGRPDPFIDHPMQKAERFFGRLLSSVSPTFFQTFRIFLYILMNVVTLPSLFSEFLEFCRIVEKLRGQFDDFV